MNTATVGVFGASGYAGMELTRLLGVHPQVTVRFLASERHVGRSVEAFTGVEGKTGRLSYVNLAEAEQAAGDCQLVLLATPAEVSLEMVPRLRARGIRVVDLSGGLRLSDAAAFQQFYGHTAPAQTLQSEAVYGLPELFRAAVKGQSLVANPGCYATAATLPLAPLLAAGALRPMDLVISALSGVSGAGRKSSEDYAFTELHDDVKAYKVLTHQHTPEITQSLSRYAGAAVELTFTPHLLPVTRGILCTTYARLAKDLDAAGLKALLVEAFGDEPFVRIVDKPEQVSLSAVVGTNQCWIGVAAEKGEGGRVVLVSAIDNLVKGAAGQAVQNLNLMLGFEESAGLTSLRRFHP